MNLVIQNKFEISFEEAEAIKVGQTPPGDKKKELADIFMNTCAQWSTEIKRALGVEAIKIAGKRDQKVRRVALCAGSGKSLLPSFLASDAQVFVGGDFGYHDGRVVENSGRVLMDVGHFASERILVEVLAERLAEALKKEGHSVEVTAYKKEQDCFRYI